MSSGLTPRHDLTRQRPERVDQLVHHSVVERHQHGQPGVVARFVHDVVDAAAHAGRQPVGPAEDAESSVESHQLGQLRVDRPLEQAHEHRDLVGRAAPVLGRERVEGQVAEAQRRGGANDRASRLHTLVVSGHAWQAAMGCPASVTVHDDGHVLGNRLGANGLEQVAFRQNDRISCSFFLSSSSTLAMKRSSSSGSGRGCAPRPRRPSCPWRVPSADRSPRSGDCGPRRGFLGDLVHGLCRLRAAPRSATASRGARSCRR